VRVVFVFTTLPVAEVVVVSSSSVKPSVYVGVSVGSTVGESVGDELGLGVGAP